MGKKNEQSIVVNRQRHKSTDTRTHFDNRRERQLLEKSRLHATPLHLHVIDETGEILRERVMRESLARRERERARHERARPATPDAAEEFAVIAE